MYSLCCDSHNRNNYQTRQDKQYKHNLHYSMQHKELKELLQIGTTLVVVDG